MFLVTQSLLTNLLRIAKPIYSDLPTINWADPHDRLTSGNVLPSQTLLLLTPSGPQISRESRLVRNVTGNSTQYQNLPKRRSSMFRRRTYTRHDFTPWKRNSLAAQIYAALLSTYMRSVYLALTTL